MKNSVLDLTVVVPTYNRFHRLPKLLKSIEAQSVHPKKVIVVDDGSTNVPNEKELQSNLGTNIEFSLIQNTSNRGASARRNQGAKEAKSEFITFVDDDDYWLPQYLENVERLFLSDGNHADVVYASGYVEDEEGNREVRFEPVGDKFLSSLLKVNFILSPGIVIRRSAFESVGGFDESLPSSQDWDLWVRLAKQFKFQSIDSPQVVHVKHNEDRISNSSKRHHGYREFYRKHIKEFLSNDMPIVYMAKAGIYCVTPPLLIQKLKLIARRDHSTR